jgi:predicted kinase
MPEQVGLIRKLHTLQLRTLALDAPEFDRRVKDGRVVEGHGDLRPEHIYLEDPPAIIDCIEFSREFRTIDIGDELAFLDMESRRLGNTSLGPRLLETWQHVSGDDIPARLYAFYGSYRACVRAKVGMLRGQQLAERGGDAESSGVLEYLHLAEQLARPLRPASLIVVGGLSGSGKSTLARQLAERLGQEVLSTDTIRQQTLGPSATPAGYGEGHYEPEQREKVYEELASRAGDALAQGASVIVDGTFLRREQRERMFDIARELGAKPLFVECKCDRATAVARITKRAAEGKSASEARVDIYKQQIQELEPPTAEEPHITVDTTQSLDEQVAVALGALKTYLQD